MSRRILKRGPKYAYERRAQNQWTLAKPRSVLMAMCIRLPILSVSRLAFVETAVTLSSVALAQDVDISLRQMSPNDYLQRLD